MKFSKAYPAATYTLNDNKEETWSGWHPSAESFFIVKLYKYSTELTDSHTAVSTQSTTSNNTSDSGGTEGVINDEKAEQNNIDITPSYSETILGVFTLISIVLIILLFILLFHWE